MSSKPKKSRTKSKNRNSSRSQNAYPTIPSAYPFPAPHWVTPHPNMVYPYQWYQPIPPVPNIQAIHNPSVNWVPQTSTSDTPIVPPKRGLAAEVTGVPRSPNEYTVDSMRRIYNNDDGSIEIERVKVQRRQGIYDTKSNIDSLHPDSKSIVPASHFLNERRPPPRKYKRKGNECQEDAKDARISVQGWYPFMPFVPQPFPYPHPYGYMWALPPQSAINIPPHFQSPTDDSDSSASHPENFPLSIHSPDLLQPKIGTPESQRPLSSATGSHNTESLGTDLGPSDSVSMRGCKRETSLERMLRKSLQEQQHSTTSDTQNSTDIEKTKEWMEDLQRAFETKSGFSSELTGDRSSFATAPSNIPTPPPKSDLLKETNSKKSFTHKKSNSESNIDDHEDVKTMTSVPLLENTRVSESDLVYVIDAREQMLRGQKENTNDTMDNSSTKLKLSSENEGRDSRTSTTSFHSTRQSGEDMLIETDSTDIAIPLDSSTTDESVDNYDNESTLSSSEEKNYKWILQNLGELSSDGEQNGEKSTNDVIESWRTEVSMWRARLVVSLCRGQGLDQQDWGTFHLLVQHPLTFDMKLSLLHAQRLCSQNHDVGVALLRNALLHLTTFGENLLKPEAERMPEWKIVTVDANQPWVLIKGSLEILRVFGYQVRENGTLRYRKKYSPEISVTARLTLDLLVLAEEFRLFLNGAHQYPINVTQLFTGARESKYPKASDLRNKEENILLMQDEVGLSAEKEFAENVEQFSEILKNDKSEQSEPTYIGENKTPTSFVPLSENITSTKQIEMEQNTENEDKKTIVNDYKIKNESPHRESGSRETLTPTPVPELNEENIPERESTSPVASEEKEKLKKHSRRVDGKDNPEDHVYEEIGDLKDQIDELKKREMSSQSPPPLPPKTKNSQVEDIYPQVDWSIDSSSPYSSLHTGSTSRRKKRRAPMPPSFLNPNEDETEHKETDANTCKNIPLYSKAVKNNKDDLSKNPFYEERIKPTGFIGKNPFYEDLDNRENNQSETSNKLLKNREETPNQSETFPNIINSEGDIGTKASLISTSQEDISETSSVFGLPAGVRPQRKKKNKKAKNVKSLSCTKENEDFVNEEANVDGGKKDETPTLIITRASLKCKTNTKNDEREHQCHSQVAVPPNDKKTGVPIPPNNMETGGSRKSDFLDQQKKDIIIKKISITYDISLDDKGENLKKKAQSKKMDEKENSAKGFTVDTKIKEELVSRLEDTKDLYIEKCEEKKETSSKGDKKRGESKTVLEDPGTNVELENSKVLKSPPLPPPKAALRLIDDIPYIDSNDVKSYKQNNSKNELRQPAHFGLAELKPNDTTSSLFSNNTENKAAAFLKRSSLVPFIDETDLPPERIPPPLPPPSPPLPPPSPPHLLSITSISFIDSESETDDTVTDGLKNNSSENSLRTTKTPNDKCENSSDKNSSPPSLTHTDENSMNLRDSLDFKNNETKDHFHSGKAVCPPSPPRSPPPSPPPTLLPLKQDKISENKSGLLLRKPRDLNGKSTDNESKNEDNLNNQSGTLHIPDCSISKDVKEVKITNNKTPTDIFNNSEQEKEVKRNSDQADNKDNLLTATLTGLSDNNSGITKEEEDITGAKTNSLNENDKKNLSEENEDTEHKSLILFGTKENSKNEIVESKGQEHEYELSEPTKIDTEERYEIPEVSRVSSTSVSLLSHSQKNKTNLVKNECTKGIHENTKNDDLPKRPPRYQLVLKAPPLPPKPERFSAPALPPKTGSLKSQKSFSESSIDQPSSSSPSTLVKCQNYLNNTERRMQPSPLAIPEMYKSLPGNLGKATSADSKQSITSSGKGIIRTSSNSEGKDLPTSQKPFYECSSLPSSPKSRKEPSKNKPKKDKKSQKSWPFLLCDCVHPTNSNDDIKYIIK